MDALEALALFNDTSRCLPKKHIPELERMAEHIKWMLDNKFRATVNLLQDEPVLISTQADATGCLTRHRYCGQVQGRKYYREGGRFTEYYLQRRYVLGFMAGNEHLAVQLRDPSPLENKDFYFSCFFKKVTREMYLQTSIVFNMWFVSSYDF